MDKTSIRNPEAYYQKALSNRLASEDRWLMSKCRAPFWGNARKLDDLTSKDDAEDFRENPLLSDKGASEEAMIRHLDRDSEPVDNGLWLKELTQVVDALNETDKAIWNALLDDYRTAPAAKRAHTNRPHVDRLKKALRVKLAAAHRLWKHRYEA